MFFLANAIVIVALWWFGIIPTHPMSAPIASITGAELFGGMLLMGWFLLAMHIQNSLDQDRAEKKKAIKELDDLRRKEPDFPSREEMMRRIYYKNTGGLY